mgnify:FL=1
MFSCGWKKGRTKKKKERKREQNKTENNHNDDEGRCSLLYACSKRFFNGALWPDGDDGDDDADEFDWFDIIGYDRWTGISYKSGRCIVLNKNRRILSIFYHSTRIVKIRKIFERDRLFAVIFIKIWRQHIQFNELNLSCILIDK